MPSLSKVASKTQEIFLPDNSPLRKTMAKADFEEAYIRYLPLLSPRTTPADLINQIDRKIPAVIHLGMKIKNTLFAPFGFSPVSLDNFHWTDLDPNQRIGEFKDRSFTAHIGISIDRSQNSIILSNRVTFHSKVGKNYMNLVKPFHKYVFKFLLNLL